MKGKVLVVDDEPAVDVLMRQMFRREIRGGDFSLGFAESGRAALARLEQEPFDIVITDINMPGMDGLTLLGEIKRRHPETVVFIVSAYFDNQKIEEARRLGAFEFINKPVDIGQMRSSLARVLTEAE